MTRIARIVVPALAAVVVALVAFPAAAADGDGIQVVDAGTALFPDRALILTTPTAAKPPLSTDDVTVTENGTAGEEPRRPHRGLRGGHRHRAPDRRLEQHEDLDRRGDGRPRARSRRRTRASRSRSCSSTSQPNVALPLTTDQKAVDAGARQGAEAR